MAGARLEEAHVVPPGRRRGREVLAVPQSAEDDRVVRVPVNEGHEHLVIDLRKPERAAIMPRAELREAVPAVDEMLSGARFGDAGRRVVLEECLKGPEVSFFVLTDGRVAMPLGSASSETSVSR